MAPVRESDLMSDLADLAVRCARAELERDQAIQRANNAERQLSELIRIVTTDDPELLLNKLHIIGIPAKNLKHMYDTVREYHEITA